MRPSECPLCRDHFMSQPLLQAEMRHAALKMGSGFAQSELNERLAEFHDEHATNETEHREDKP